MALSSGKIGKCNYLTSKEILPPDQTRLTEQAKFIYSTLEDEALKVLKSVKQSFSNRFRN